VTLTAALLVLSSQPINALTTLTDGRQAREVHGPPPTIIEWTILVFVVGQSNIINIISCGRLSTCRRITLPC